MNQEMAYTSRHCKCCQRQTLHFRYGASTSVSLGDILLIILTGGLFILIMIFRYAKSAWLCQICGSK